MSGPTDPSEQFNILNDKLERLLIAEEQLSAQMTTVNNRLDAHGKRLAQLENASEGTTSANTVIHQVTDASAHGKADHDTKDDGGGLGDPTTDQGTLDEDVIAIQQLGGNRGGFAGHGHHDGGGRGGSRDGFAVRDSYGGDFSGVGGDDHFGGGYGGGARFDGGYGGDARFGSGRGGRDRYGGDRGGCNFGRFHHEDGVSRRPKLNFPNYDGESDLLTWLNKCETYFRGMRTMEEKVWIASLHLEGVAAEWYYALERDYGIISWVRFADFVHMRFGPPLRMNGQVELKDLHRTSSVEEYQQQFPLLLCRCDDLTPMQQVNLFTADLGEPLRTDVELLAPSNLQSAMNLARAYEHRVTLVATKGKSSGSSSPLITSGQKTGIGMTVLKPANTNKPRFKRLTAEELAAKRANGECYRCTEKYSTDHQCSSKGVFLLELDDGVEEVEAIEELGISLHALTGIDVANTMKLRVKINGTELLALVDIGSSHTFICDSVAHQLVLQMTPRSGLLVKVANGDV
jgi:hypothetical protein